MKDFFFWKEFLCRIKICSKAVHGEKWGACNIFGVFVCAEGEKVKVHMTYIWDDQVMRWKAPSWTSSKSSPSPIIT